MSEETRKYIERGKSDCWPWQYDPEEAPNKDVLMACRNPMCCNPRHISKAAVTDEPSADESATRRRRSAPQ